MSNDCKRCTPAIEDPLKLHFCEEHGTGLPPKAAYSHAAKETSPAWVSGTCCGETCTLCKAPAAHKIGEEIAFDDPFPNRHNLTAYVCDPCFRRIMGDWGVDWVNAHRPH